MAADPRQLAARRRRDGRHVRPAAPAVKAIFFFADTGYPDFNRVGRGRQQIPPSCQSGADCVYQRYLAIGRGPAFEAAGVTDVDSFTQLYWREQFASGGAAHLLSVGGALGGGLMFGLANRRKPDERPRRQARQPTPARSRLN